LDEKSIQINDLLSSNRRLGGGKSVRFGLNGCGPIPRNFEQRGRYLETHPRGRADDRTSVLNLREGLFLGERGPKRLQERTSQRGERGYNPDLTSLERVAQMK